MTLIFKNDDYVIRTKKPKRCKQSIIPGKDEKKGKYYNGSKSVAGNFKAEFKKAKNINN